MAVCLSWGTQLRNSQPELVLFTLPLCLLKSQSYLSACAERVSLTLSLAAKASAQDWPQTDLILNAGYITS